MIAPDVVTGGVLFAVNMATSFFATKLKSGEAKRVAQTEFDSYATAASAAIDRELRQAEELLDWALRDQCQAKGAINAIETSAFDVIAESMVPLDDIFNGQSHGDIDLNEVEWELDVVDGRFAKWGGDVDSMSRLVERIYHRIKMLKCRVGVDVDAADVSLKYVRWLITVRRWAREEDTARRDSIAARIGVRMLQPA